MKRVCQGNTPQPWEGLLPYGLQAGESLGNQVSGSNTRLKGLSRRVQDGRSTVLSQVRRDSGPAWEEKLLSFPRMREQISCIVWVHNMAGLVSSNLYCL